MKTIIMAGGLGTRIAELFPDIPKPLIPITDSSGETKPVLEWEIENLVRQGFREIVLTVGYMAEKIQAYFGSGERLGAEIRYYREKTPLGNAGALLKMRDQLGNDPLLLLNADTVFNIDFNRMVQWHREKKALVTLFTHPNSHPYDSGIIVADERNAVMSWLTKEEQRPTYYKNRVNAGLHVINPEVLDMAGIDSTLIGIEDENGKLRKVDLDRQILQPLCGNGRMFAYDSPEYVKDMGTPERYEGVSRDFRHGVVQAKNLSRPQRAIFLDRDGTLNRYVGFLRKPEELELLEGVTEAVQRINNSGFLAIVITNQPVIARGEVTVEELRTIHNKLETELGKAGAYIDSLYYCPHHPHSGYDGEIKELKTECTCRKPKPGLLLRAAKDYNIILADSWMIGDGVNDVLAGKTAGCHTALISSDKKNECGADMVVGSLLEAVEKILDS